jgi:hypothetical protein
VNRAVTLKNNEKIIVYIQLKTPNSRGETVSASAELREKDPHQQRHRWNEERRPLRETRAAGRGSLILLVLAAFSTSHASFLPGFRIAENCRTIIPNNGGTWAGASTSVSERRSPLG